MRAIDKLIIHCAATPNGRPFKIRDIDRWHASRVDARELAGRSEEAIRHYSTAFPYIGYHDVIEVDGEIQPGRGENEVGSHAAPWNGTSIGVCLIGTDKFTRAQWESLTIYVADVEKRYGAIEIIGHRQVPGCMKTCPGFSVPKWLEGGRNPLEGQVF